VQITRRTEKRSIISSQRDTSKISLTYKKDIELSKDEEKLIKKTLTDYFDKNKEKNLKDQGIQVALSVDKIMNGEDVEKKSKKEIKAPVNFGREYLILKRKISGKELFHF